MNGGGSGGSPQRGPGAEPLAGAARCCPGLEWNSSGGHGAEPRHAKRWYYTPLTGSIHVRLFE